MARAPVEIPFGTSNLVSALAQVSLGIALTSLAEEPKRRQLHAIILASLASVYTDAGFGVWEIPFTIAIGFFAYKGLRAPDSRTGYAMLGLGWLLHGSWDLAHHAKGWPMVSWWPSITIECVVIDAVQAIYCFMGGKSIFGRR